MDPIKKLKLRLCYICGESLVLLLLVSTLVLNLALSNLTKLQTNQLVPQTNHHVDSSDTTSEPNYKQFIYY